MPKRIFSYLNYLSKKAMLCVCAGGEIVAFQRYVRAHLGVHGVFVHPALVLPPRLSIMGEVPGVCVVFGAQLLFPVAICAADAIAAASD
jgi:hypothetical protein